MRVLLRVPAEAPASGSAARPIDFHRRLPGYQVSPLVGNSAVLVRSDDSWHAVSRVAEHCRLSRRSLTATTRLMAHAGACA